MLRLDRPTDCESDVQLNRARLSRVPVHPPLLLLLLLLSKTGVGDRLRQAEHRFGDVQSTASQFHTVWPNPDQYSPTYSTAEKFDIALIYDTLHKHLFKATYSSRKSRRMNLSIQLKFNLFGPEKFA